MSSGALALDGQPNPGPIPRDLLEQADLNRDGSVTFEELRSVVPFLTRDMFNELDRNDDGVLSSADLPEPPPPPGGDDLLRQLQYLLAEADANRDGRVTFAEARAVLPALTEMTFHVMDRNRDGVLTQADLPVLPPPGEIAGHLLYLLERADANRDGRVTLEEARLLMPTLTHDAFAMMDRNGDRVLTRHDLPAPPGDNPIHRLLGLLRVADADHNGEVTYEELLAVAPDFPEEMFHHLDRNDDGVLSPADLPEGGIPWEQVLELLRRADADRNGEVTLAELQAVVPQITEEQFNRLDRNHDGVISREDLPPPPPQNWWDRLRRLLHEADADNNQQVTLEEIRALRPHFPERAFNFLDRNDDGVLSRADLPAGPPPGPIEALLRLLRHADADNDGRVTLAELQAIVPEVTQEIFDRLDRNDDGFLDRDDVPPFIEHPLEALLRLLREADTNGDNAVSFEELQALLPGLTQEQFDRLDRNDDGVISRDDLPEPPRDPIQRLIHLLQRADVDTSGQVTFEELQAVAPDLTREQFDRLDRNGDGVISREDLPAPPDDPRDRLLALLRRADVNGDRRVTFEELHAVVPELTQEHFDRLDRNRDGVISAEDVPNDSLPRDDDSRREFIRHLIQADTNGDGALDYNEIAAAFPNAPADLLAQIDTNHDWSISRRELMAALGRGGNGALLYKDDDLDASGGTDAVDVQVVINHALGLLGGPLAADVNGDGKVDANDIQSVINGALGLR